MPTRSSSRFIPAHGGGEQSIATKIRFIPAYAGEGVTLVFSISFTAVHPRVRGGG